jgi:hypothetical protein
LVMVSFGESFVLFVCEVLARAAGSEMLRRENAAASLKLSWNWTRWDQCRSCCQRVFIGEEQDLSQRGRFVGKVLRI